MFEFDARVVGSELPICFGVVFVSIGFPRGDLLDERGSVRNAAVEALRRENAEFGFGERASCRVLAYNAIRTAQ